MACSDYNDLMCKTCANHTNWRINLKCSQILTNNSYLNYFSFFLKLTHSSLNVFSSSLGEFGSNFTSKFLDIVSLSLGFVSRHEDWRRSSGITWRGKLFFYLQKEQYKIVFKFTLLQFIFGNFILKAFWASSTSSALRFARPWSKTCIPGFVKYCFNQATFLPLNCSAILKTIPLSLAFAFKFTTSL